jgi:hypothetical protein
VQSDESGKNIVRFVAKWECEKIVPQQEIMFVARDADNWRSADVTMQKLKRKQSSCCGRRKRQPDVLAATAIYMYYYWMGYS